jgi:hypothetical protein
LLEAGIPEESMFAVPQGYKLMSYILTTERKLQKVIFTMLDSTNDLGGR